MVSSQKLGTTKNPAWQVKGVTPETREAVKKAASKSGLTIGQWVNQTLHREAVADITGQRSLPTKRLEDQLAEINDRLQEMDQPFWRLWRRGKNSKKSG